MTHATRELHTHVAGTMNIHINADGGLVSNPRDREMQGSSAHAAAPNLDAWDLSWDEPRIAKRDVGHINNRTLIDPSVSESRTSAYLGKTTGRDWNGILFVCVFRNVI